MLYARYNQIERIAPVFQFVHGKLLHSVFYSINIQKTTHKNMLCVCVSFFNVLVVLSIDCCSKWLVSDRVFNFVFVSIYIFRKIRKRSIWTISFSPFLLYLLTRHCFAHGVPTTNSMEMSIFIYICFNIVQCF